MNDEYTAVMQHLDQFYQHVTSQIGDLERSLQQIDKYQHDIQALKQKLAQEEQLLKSMTPNQTESIEKIQVGVISLTRQLTTHIHTHSTIYYLLICLIHEMWQRIFAKCLMKNSFSHFFIFFCDHHLLYCKHCDFFYLHIFSVSEMFSSFYFYWYWATLLLLLNRGEKRENHAFIFNLYYWSKISGCKI
jgi:hypothetical protein